MVNERAKQFLPFQSLKGLETELRKKERVIIGSRRRAFLSTKSSSKRDDCSNYLLSK